MCKLSVKEKENNELKIKKYKTKKDTIKSQQKIKEKYNTK
ncbi:13963_t:CDS:2 [Gigaspora margarita]|uniref:13963_t:CDS:1 n=1 Tax=Gigaspora margarita TaxID=4874 RepID=A0ABN7UJN0_GIGMA|nr:13963_t:CDS:2 [Gigaspora margarita]